MIDRKDAVRIGKITRKYGYEGNVVLITDASLKAVASLPEYIFVDIREKLVPFRVASSQQRSEHSHVAELMDMNDVLISRVLDCDVWIQTGQNNDPEPSSTAEDKIRGYAVHDKVQGYIGDVASLADREIQPLLVVMNGRIEILIPYTPEVVRKTDHRRKKIHIDAPDGLIDLYLQP